MAIFKFHVDLDLLKNLTAADKEVIKKTGDSAFLLETMITNMLVAKGQGGPSQPPLAGLKRKIWTRILKKLDESIDDQIDLDPSELDFLKEILLDETLPPRPEQVRLHAIFEEGLLAALSESTK